MKQATEARPLLPGRVRFARPNESLRVLNASGRRMVRPRRIGSPVLTRPIGWIAAAALVAVFCLLRFDERVSRAMALEPDGVRAFLAYATDAGLVAWYLYPALVLVLSLALISSIEASRRSLRRRNTLAVHGAYLAGSVALAQILVQILKAFFGRARPVLVDDHGALAFELLRLGYDYASFPSGHSATMAAVTVAAMIWLPSVRWPLLVVGVCLAVSRVVVQAHFPSDVVAGWSIGFLTALILARWLAVRRIAFAMVGTGRGWRGLIPVRARSRAG